MKPDDSYLLRIFVLHTPSPPSVTITGGVQCTHECGNDNQTPISDGPGTCPSQDGNHSRDIDKNGRDGLFQESR